MACLAATTLLASGARAGETGAAAIDAALARSPMCFPADMTREEMIDAIRRYNLLPPAQLEVIDGLRFTHDTFVWEGDPPNIGPAAQAARTVLTYSFPADGAQWGLAAIDPASVQPNALNAELVNEFGDLDLGREYIRQALAAWSRWCGVFYREIPDDNSPMDQVTQHLPLQRGDIRIGGGPVPNSPYLAYNAFPSGLGGPTVGGGDMFIDTLSFNFLNFSNPSNNYRYFRNVMAHEHGHGLGLFHAVPCSQSKLMEPQAVTGVDGLSIDEIRGGARNYNDRFAPNHTANSGFYIGTLTVPGPVPGSFTPISWGARRLALNGAAGPNNTGSDWFQFDTQADIPGFSIVAGPVGGIYDTGAQTTGCNGAVNTVNADIIGDLEIELIELNSGNTWISSSTGPGGTETIAVPVLSAGIYNLRITDIGPTSGDQVQLYDLGIFAGTPLPPTSFPGISKRCRGAAPCWFLGDINSSANDPNATIIGYEWDLDGDGVFETIGPAQLPFVYPSSAGYSVGLRVIDSNGMTDERRMHVTVHDSITMVNSITPAFGYLGRTASVQIDGANFLLPSTTLSFSGTGIQVVAAGASNALGTTLGGFLFIDPSTPPGFYDVRVTNTEGSDTLVGAFQVRCVGDLNGDNVFNFADLNILLGVYNQTIPGHPADLDQSGTIDFADLNILLGLFNQTC